MPISSKILFSEYPLGIQFVLLTHLESSDAETMKRARKIENEITDRNTKGISLEKSGDLKKAIEVYENNVSIFADTQHPYERLRIIYTKQKKYDDAIRVCQAFINMSKQLERVVLLELKDKNLAEKVGDIQEYDVKINKILRLQHRDKTGLLPPSFKKISIAPPVYKVKESLPKQKRYFPWKVIGIIFAILSLSFFACFAFGLFLSAIGYGK
jgi:tetratricopeptide (TPR) repeat protein